MTTYQTSSLAASLRIQARVIWALVLREIITRYGRHNIGFLWLFVEPMLFTTGIAALWTAIHATHGSGVPIVPFAITGYAGVLLWRNGVGRCADAVEPNKALLFHRCPGAGLLLRALAAGDRRRHRFLSADRVGSDLPRLDEVPADLGQMLAGWMLLAWYALGLGLVVGALSGVPELMDRIWHPITYLYFPFSGAGYMVSWLPLKWQKYAEYLPTVNLNEMIRGGYFGGRLKCTSMSSI
jgi:ABC-type polysaccharide/polyol phosphate export permease